MRKPTFRRGCASSLLIALAIVLATLLTPDSAGVHARDKDVYLRYLLELARKPPPDNAPSEEIFMKNGVIFCTGSSKAALHNNKAARLIEKGKYDDAITLLNTGLENAALFFPFRYNMGTCYLFKNDLKRSLLHFTKAQQVVPEYSKTYLQIGFIYSRYDDVDTAIVFFKKALERNSKELETFILIGDIFFKRKQVEMARKFYAASLELSPRYTNGLIGMAKVLYVKEKYIQAIVLFKSVKITGDYDRSLHYYYAEASYKLRDYKRAKEQYEKLLQFKKDKFFLNFSIDLIEYKKNLSEDFAQGPMGE
ncbi:MAG: tetratricopeptide repeat protein [bacterium]|nr:tetratricopeptide repeat protein [bacterium]